MVFIAVRNDDAAHPILILNQICVVRYDKVYTGHIAAGESKPRIYYDYILSEFKGGHVLTDFSYSAQESYFQGFGIGTKLLIQLEKYVPDRDIFLYASITARPFFEKMGYETIAENHAVRNGITLKNYLMKKLR